MSLPPIGGSSEHYKHGQNGGKRSSSSALQRLLAALDHESNSSSPETVNESLDSSLAEDSVYNSCTSTTKNSIKLFFPDKLKLNDFKQQFNHFLNWGSLKAQQRLSYHPQTLFNIQNDLKLSNDQLVVFTLLLIQENSEFLKPEYGNVSKAVKGFKKHFRSLKFKPYETFKKSLEQNDYYLLELLAMKSAADQPERIQSRFPSLVDPSLIGDARSKSSVGGPPLTQSFSSLDSGSLNSSDTTVDSQSISDIEGYYFNQWTSVFGSKAFEDFLNIYLYIYLEDHASSLSNDEFAAQYNAVTHDTGDGSQLLSSSSPSIKKHKKTFDTFIETFNAFVRGFPQQEQSLEQYQEKILSFVQRHENFRDLTNEQTTHYFKMMQAAAQQKFKEFAHTYDAFVEWGAVRAETLASYRSDTLYCIKNQLDLTNQEMVVYIVRLLHSVLDDSFDFSFDFKSMPTVQDKPIDFKNYESFCALILTNEYAAPILGSGIGN